jgi:uncharacterized membrane protein
MGKFVGLFTVIFLLFLVPQPTLAQDQILAVQDEKMEARVENILEEKIIEAGGSNQFYQKLELVVTNGNLKDKIIEIENGNSPVVNNPKFNVGDEVMVSRSRDIEGNDLFYIADFVRRGPLLWLLAIFSALVVLIGRWKGLASLIGMGISFAVIFFFILPQILAGQDPILISILGSLAIIPATFYLSHGINRKTTVAILGTLSALIITGILANIFVEAAKLTGFAQEEASFLQIAKQGTINIKGLLLAGIIIGVLGILDDITVSQASVVEQLRKANKELKGMDLYLRVMSVGRDHIASMVNTLVLVYTGAAMPLLLLFVNNPYPFSEVINYEIIAEEIIRTLVGSIGLILAVPITSYIAVVVMREKKLEGFGKNQ